VSDVELARIRGGRLQMQTPRTRRRRTIEVDDFELGVYPVTEEQLAEVLGITADHPRRPAVRVSWLRAVRFANALSEWEGLERAYRVDGDEITWDRTSEGYRLPTDAEWEYACRAGSVTPQYGPLADIAWTALDGVRTPQDVGARLPNLNGLFDTLGNVWERCWDLLDPAGDPRGHRVVRGGGYADDAYSVRADVRRGGAPRLEQGDVGFRIARGALE